MADPSRKSPFHWCRLSIKAFRFLHQKHPKTRDLWPGWGHGGSECKPGGKPTLEHGGHRPATKKEEEKLKKTNQPNQGTLTVSATNYHTVDWPPLQRPASFNLLFLQNAGVSIHNESDLSFSGHIKLETRYMQVISWLNIREHTFQWPSPSRACYFSFPFASSVWPAPPSLGNPPNPLPCPQHPHCQPHCLKKP